MLRCLPVYLSLFTMVAYGCAGGPHQQAGAMVGTGIGALTGAVIGHESGHAGGGALIGGAIGGLAGSLAGQTEDIYKAEENAFRQASYQQVRANALSNNDVVMMSINQVGDQVIVNSIQTKGGLFDLSPQGLVSLKQQGVSDVVIQAMQDSANRPQLASAPPVRSRSSEVIVTPGITLYDPHCAHHDYHYFSSRRHHSPPRHHRSGIYIHGKF